MVLITLDRGLKCKSPLCYIDSVYIDNAPINTSSLGYCSKNFITLDRGLKMQSGSLSYVLCCKNLYFENEIQNISDRVAIIVREGILICLVRVALPVVLPRWSHSLVVIG